MKEDNEQLATQYEREKCLRKATEQKLLEVEYASEEERNDLQSKVSPVKFPFEFRSQKIRVVTLRLHREDRNAS